jgi:hypothetical protein
MQVQKYPRKLRKYAASNSVKHIIEQRLQMYSCIQKKDGLYYSCEIKNGYVYNAYTDGNWLYTEIIKRCTSGIYRYYPKIKILTYGNDYTYKPVVYTQDY